MPPPTPRPKPPALALSIDGESDTDTVSMVTALSRASSPADTVFTAPLWTGGSAAAPTPTPTPRTPKHIPGAWEERYSTPPPFPGPPANSPRSQKTSSTATPKGAAAGGSGGTGTGIGLGRPPRRRGGSDRSHAGSERTIKTIEYANGDRYVSAPPPPGWVPTLPASPQRRVMSQTLRYAMSDEFDDDDLGQPMGQPFGFQHPFHQPLPPLHAGFEGLNRAPPPPQQPHVDMEAENAWTAFVRAQLQRLMMDGVVASQLPPNPPLNLVDHVAALRAEIEELRAAVAQVAANQRPASLVAAVEHVAAAVESVAAAESIPPAPSAQQEDAEDAEARRVHEELAQHVDHQIGRGEEGAHRGQSSHIDPRGYDEQLQHAEQPHDVNEPELHPSSNAAPSDRVPTPVPTDSLTDRSATPVPTDSITVPGRAGPLHFTPTTVSLVLEVVRAIDRARHVDHRPDEAVFDDDNLVAIIDDARAVLDEKGVSIFGASTRSALASAASEDGESLSTRRRLVPSEASVADESHSASAPLSPPVEAASPRTITVESPEPFAAEHRASVNATPTPIAPVSVTITQ
ncbi:uncharacterized protein LOC62_04G005661 [Vanrija pseudolonga]|uniref:Uncharacterized protein n=1 Tax=Vanrija pseudolonga TaxID=143232 RepID=A0AAF0YC81_9TREE|nr:hypothetical protein LOC62_04G005661 [Vanrija pseudolonga]